MLSASLARALAARGIHYGWFMVALTMGYLLCSSATLVFQVCCLRQCRVILAGQSAIYRVRLDFAWHCSASSPLSPAD